MQIKRMENEYLDEIIWIDELIFKRPEPRSIANLKALRMSDPDGCFVLMDGHRIVGFNYSKTMGTEGYLGPLGILDKYQNQGFGKALIFKTIEYLRKNCKVIGLEALPEKGNLIGFYQKIGFISGFPSYLFQISEGFKLKKAYFDDFQITNACEMTSSKYLKVLDEVEKWTRNYNQVSYKKDLIATRELEGDLFIAFNGDEPVGFLGYSKTLLPTLWGTVNSNLPDYNKQKNIMKGLITYFNEVNGFKDVILQMNSRHRVMVDIIIEMGFKFRRSVNRMYLTDFEGDHLKKSDELIMRSWRG